MPLPATYLRVTMNFRNPTTGAKATSVLWYLPASAGTTITLANVALFANDFKTAFTSAIQGALSDVAAMDSLTLKWVTGGNEVEGNNNNGAIGGSVGGDCLPEEDVIVIQRRTGKVGRSKRGRIFFPFISEDFVEDGELNAAGKTAAAALAAMVKSNVTAQGAVFNPKTLDHKNNVLETVVQAGYITATCSRRDRRFPKQLTSIRV